MNRALWGWVLLAGMNVIACGGSSSPTDSGVRNDSRVGTDVATIDSSRSDVVASDVPVGADRALDGTGGDVAMDSGGGVTCGNATCTARQFCCPSTTMCCTIGDRRCCSTMVDAATDVSTIDIPRIDVPLTDVRPDVDRCATVRCRAGTTCCPYTGNCYPSACLSCCMPL